MCSVHKKSETDKKLATVIVGLFYLKEETRWLNKTEKKWPDNKWNIQSLGKSLLIRWQTHTLRQKNIKVEKIYFVLKNCYTQTAPPYSRRFRNQPPTRSNRSVRAQINIFFWNLKPVKCRLNFRGCGVLQKFGQTLLHLSFNWEWCLVAESFENRKKIELLD